MKAWKLVLVAGLIIGFIALSTIIGISMFVFDLASYTAVGSTTLEPAGTAVGSALVVYNPGISGDAKDAADIVAGDLGKGAM